MGCGIITSKCRFHRHRCYRTLKSFAFCFENIETQTRRFAPNGFAVSKTSSLVCVIITSDNRLSAISPLSRLGGFAAPSENIETSICFRFAKTNACAFRTYGASNLVEITTDNRLSAISPLSPPRKRKRSHLPETNSAPCKQ